MLMIDPTKWLCYSEVVVIQSKYWIITHFKYMPQYYYLSHFCSKNRKRVEINKSLGIECIDYNDNQCRFCKANVPVDIKIAYLMLESGK